MGLRLSGLAAAIGLAAALLPVPAYATAKYSDYRWTTPDVFARTGDEWHQVSTGGFSNSTSRWICYPSHAWSGCTRYGDEVGTWKMPDGNAFAYGDWQAYITSSGTNTYATYSDGYSDPAINQYSVHGWVTLLQDGYCCGRAWLSDAESPAYWVSGHKTDWDAIRFVY
jgi:hypothetical protein